jgi:hypothetical protein
MSHEYPDILGNNSTIADSKMRKRKEKTYVVHTITVSTKPCDNGITNHCESRSLQNFTAIEVFLRVVGSGPLD